MPTFAVIHKISDSTHSHFYFFFFFICLSIVFLPSVPYGQGFHTALANRLQLSVGGRRRWTAELDPVKVEAWRDMAEASDLAETTATIALVGKYTDLRDSYLSVISSLKVRRYDMTWQNITLHLAPLHVIFSRFVVSLSLCLSVSSLYFLFLCFYSFTLKPSCNSLFSVTFLPF